MIVWWVWCVVCLHIICHLHYSLSPDLMDEVSMYVSCLIGTCLVENT